MYQHSGMSLFNITEGSICHSPLLGFLFFFSFFVCFNSLMYVEQAVTVVKRYNSIISVTTVSLWHFPLYNLLKVHCTFWPEGGALAKVLMSHKKKRLNGFVKFHRMRPADHIWSDFFFLLKPVLWADLQTKCSQSGSHQWDIM